MSKLRKTWFIDLDGTIVKHNGYKESEEILDGVQEFFINNIQEDDYVILTTSREKKYIKSAIDLLLKSGIKYNIILSDLPHGERIIINDSKPDGLKTAYSINVIRNEGLRNIFFNGENKNVNE